jgi:uncharacterized repeat protein (TIGR03843 family)
MKKEWIEQALLESQVSLEGQFIYGSNYTFMVAIQFEGEAFNAVYKPQKGERALWDFPGQTLAKREVAAYLVSEALGWAFVPPTVFRVENLPMGPGSLQVFIEHNPEDHYFNNVDSYRQQLPRITAFDLLVNNADRKGGHLLLDLDRKLWLIDHGLCFHVEEKLRTVVWDCAGDPIPDLIMADIEQFKEQLLTDGPIKWGLRGLISESEITALFQRAEKLLDEGHFPLPPEDRRAYPWPLV